MAKRKRKPIEPQRVLESATVAEDIGRPSAIALGALGFVALVFFFIPWFGDQLGTLSGLQLLSDSAQLTAVPAHASEAAVKARSALAKELGDVGGRGFMAATLLAVLLAVGTGFAARQLRGLLGRWTREYGMLLAAILIGVGFVQLMVMLNMTVLTSTQFPGIAFGATLLLAGVAALGWTAGLDAHAGDREGALAPRDWGILLGGLFVTALIHYIGICYGLIQKGPDFLISQMRRGAGLR